MCDKNEISNIVEALISEASAAADLLLSETADLEVPCEVIEAAQRTKSLLESITANPPSSAAKLKKYNWRLHIICSELYLNIQRVDKDKRERLFNVISSYKLMMYHYSTAQMKLAPPAPAELALDLEHHARILKNIAQNEINRLAKAAVLEKKTAGLLLGEANTMTAKLAEALLKGEATAEACGLFGVFTAHLREYAQALGDKGGTLLYLAEEYDFFISKVSEFV